MRETTMTTMGMTSRIRALRMRPLATGLAAVFVASVSFASPASAVTDKARELAARFPEIIVPAPPARPAAIVSNCDDSGPGSLRDTAENAVDGDLIDLSGLSCSRISLTTGAIVLGQSDLAIQGPGENALTIDGTLSGAALYHVGSGTLEVNDLTIGYAFKYLDDVDVLGSCIHSQGNVLLTNVRVTTCNTVSAGAHAALGGGIWAEGIVQLDHSDISGNEAKASGYGYASGGGVYALGGLVSLYSTISHNAVLSESATPTFGGGGFARGASFILGTTVNNNYAARDGGLALADNTGLTSNIINSTVSTNHAGTIGGVFSRGPLNIYNSTIVFNTSYNWTDGSGHYFAAGVYITTSGNLDSTIISNNVNSAQTQFPTADATGASGAGWNGSNNNVMACLLPCPTDTSHEDPGLHPLMDNGGPTKTHVPTPGQWDTFGGTNVLALPYEQRSVGFPRQSAGDFPEIGALQINSDVIFANGFN